MQAVGCILRSDERRGPAVQGAGRSGAAEAPGPAARARRPDLERAVSPPGHESAGCDPAPRRARSGEPRGGAVAWAREAALPQPGAAAGGLRPLDSQVRAAAPRGVARPETPAGRDG